MTEQRPDPDKLLEKVQRAEARAGTGRLKIFFGACAGVGKTYAMLTEAREVLAEGVDVVVGVVETHRRAETEALVDGLRVIPQRRVEYRGAVLHELDIDAVLARRPELVLVDELAHSNAPGSRHPKRWQDIKELLAAGIDVYTTVNVQHLESLNDVVGQITNIRISETVPDRVFDEADEVELVDLPSDDLIQRLKTGKVYMPEQAAHAVTNFFRKGNLIALRELALRRTADRVDAQAREYRDDEAIKRVWQLKERLVGRGRSGRAFGAGRSRRTPPRRTACAPNGSRFTSRRRRCSACRKRSAPGSCARCGSRRNSAPKPRRVPGQDVATRADRICRRAQRRQDRARAASSQPLCGAVGSGDRTYDALFGARRRGGPAGRRRRSRRATGAGRLARGTRTARPRVEMARLCRSAWSRSPSSA